MHIDIILGLRMDIYEAINYKKDNFTKYIHTCEIYTQDVDLISVPKITYSCNPGFVSTAHNVF